MGGARLRRTLFVLLALASGVLFFASLDRLWPLADLDLTASRSALDERARTLLADRGFDVQGHRSATWLVVDGPRLDYVESRFGRRRTQQWIAGGLPLAWYRTQLKQEGSTVYYVVDQHPDGTLRGWSRHVEEDQPGGRLPADVARRVAVAELSDGLRLEVSAYEERAASTTEQPERLDHSFRFERRWSAEPELRERVRVQLAGEQVVATDRTLIVPGDARREARAAEAPGRALETLGFALLAAGAVAAFFIFLKRLQSGLVDLGQAIVWPSAVFVCLIGTYALQTGDLFGYWEPLWPRWVSAFRYLVFRALQEIWLVLVLLAVVAAGNALDRESGAGRGTSLFALGHGKLLDAGVTRASFNGFLVGLLCGGAMAAAVILLQWTVGAETRIQPRGFFFYTLNSSAPALTSLLFFFGVALAEELGYRYFAGSWLMALTRRRWLAITLPALVYGLTHTRLDFLPPSQPFWGRALVLTAVGAVWGWAFFRFDALTVVLSHFTADLFIFNWPRLASGDPLSVTAALLVMLVPLSPALLGSLVRLGRPRGPGAATPPANGVRTG